MSTDEKKSEKKVVQQRRISGIVVSKSGDKTIVVQVERKLRHKLYSKMYKRTKKYHVHDEKNQFAVGDTVEFVACRPYSKLKNWRVVT